MKLSKRSIVALGLAWAALAALAPTALAEPGEGSLATAEFPDVVEFDFEKVQANYEQVSENVGEVTPVLDGVLEQGKAAVAAGQAVREDPTEQNKRRFVAAVLKFVRGAGKSKAKIAEMAEEVRGIRSQMDILYAEATTQTKARVEELRKEFEREEVKLKDIVAANKARRKEEDLSDWELRKLFREEKRQAQRLSRISDRIAFQQDFLKALAKADDRAGGDFTIYEQFFAETSEALTDISDLASNLPIVVERLQVASAMAGSIPSRRAAVAGFGKIEETRELTKQIADQLMELCSGELLAGEEDAQVEKVLIKRTRTYRQWLEGETVGYRRPPRAEK